MLQPNLPDLELPPPAPRMVSDCCGAPVEAHPEQADPLRRAVCTQCRNCCEPGPAKAPPRSCPQCWRHLDLRDWRGCKDQFCVAWEECRELTPEETEALETNPDRRPYR
jgi:hypothetical protein